MSYKHIFFMSIFGGLLLQIGLTILEPDPIPEPEIQKTSPISEDTAKQKNCKITIPTEPKKYKDLSKTQRYARVK